LNAQKYINAFSLLTHCKACKPFRGLYLPVSLHSAQYTGLRANWVHKVLPQEFILMCSQLKKRERNEIYHNNCWPPGIRTVL